MSVQGLNVNREVDNVTWTVSLDAVNSVSIDRTGAMSFLNGQERQDNALVSECASDVLQMTVDAPHTVLLTDLAIDDPDRTTDPATFKAFHARVAQTWGQGQNRVDVYRAIADPEVGGVATHLVSRSFLVNVVYEGDIQTATIRTQSPPQNWRTIPATPPNEEPTV